MSKSSLDVVGEKTSKMGLRNQLEQKKSNNLVLVQYNQRLR